MVLVSAVIGVLTLWLLWTSRFAVASFTSAAAVGTVLVGWALAQRPDVLPGELSLQDAAAGDATLLATLIVLAVALLVIVPAMALLFRLALAGRLSEEFRPIVGPGDGGAS